VILSAALPRLAAATPNVVSSLRLVLAAAFPFLPDGWRAPAILTAALTDLLDGYIARRFSLTSWQGGLLDGIADKLFVLSALLTFTLDDAAGSLTVAGAMLLLTRDITVTMIFAYIVVRRRWDAARNMPSRPLGKAATAAIYLVLFVLSLHVHAPALVSRTPIILAGAVTLITLAAMDYLLVFARALANDRHASRPPGGV
jgi:cardiolipin synthase